MTTQTIALKPRMNHPVAIYPEAMRALQALGKTAHNAAVPLPTLMLVELRASQINGCSACVDMHSRDLKKHGETTSGSSASPRGATTPPSTRPNVPRSHSPRR